MRTAATIAGMSAVLGLALGGLAGCSDDDPGQTPASTEDFCASFNDLVADAGESSHGDLAAQIQAVKEGADRLGEVGAPADMPADAARGLDVFVDAIGQIDDDAEAADLQDLGNDLSAGDEKDGEAFVEWAQTTCLASASPSAD